MWLIWWKRKAPSRMGLKPIFTPANKIATCRHIKLHPPAHYNTRPFSPYPPLKHAISWTPSLLNVLSISPSPFLTPTEAPPDGSPTCTRLQRRWKVKKILKPIFCAISFIAICVSLFGPLIYCAISFIAIFVGLFGLLICCAISYTEGYMRNDRILQHFILGRNFLQTLGAHGHLMINIWVYSMIMIMLHGSLTNSIYIMPHFGFVFMIFL